REARDARARLDAHLAVVRPEFAGDQLQQGGLAGAIATDDGDALATLDGEFGPVEQQRSADRIVEPDEVDERHAVWSAPASVHAPRGRRGDRLRRQYDAQRVGAQFLR